MTERDLRKILGLPPDESSQGRGQDLQVRVNQLVKDVADLKVRAAKNETRVERLKNKARTQIDKAWNKAVEEAAAKVEAGGTAEDVRSLKRRVR